MIAPTTHEFAVDIRSKDDVGAARRAVRALGVSVGLPDPLIAKAELAATELGTNIANHAGVAGEILVQPVHGVGAHGIEIIAVDAGTGIVDLDRALAGRQAGGVPELTVGLPDRRSLGCGLASTRRLATEFDIYTQRRQGTVVLARFFAERGVPHQSLRCGGVSVPVERGGGNGDAWGCHRREQELSLLVIDGLGHGDRAAAASHAGIEAFAQAGVDDLGDCIARVHQAMRSTRGGAGSLCRIVPGGQRIEFTGVGNVEGRVFRPGERARGLASRGGTLGAGLQPPRAVIVTQDWTPGSVLVMHTDGIRRHFDFDGYPSLLGRDPTVIAAVLYRDLSRRRDDATVVVVQDLREPGA